MRKARWTIVALIGLTVEAAAQAPAPCEDFARLRAAANEAWKQVQRASPSNLCASYLRFSWADEAVVTYARDNLISCGISAQDLDAMAAHHRTMEVSRHDTCSRQLPQRRPSLPEKIRY
jgi:hypothetical protein